MADEMELLADTQKVRIFLFQDDDFPLAGRPGQWFVAELTDEIRRRGLHERCIWKISCRAEYVEPEMFSTLREAGLYLVYTGLESGSDEGLEILNKQIGVQTNRDFVIDATGRTSWFARQLGHRRTGRTAAAVDVRVHTAGTSRLDPVTDGDSWLAIGDAAIACDPLWGQGVVTALETGLTAAESVTEHATLLEQNTLVQRRFQGYQRLRAAYYRRETRWPQSVFWARRPTNQIT